MLFSDRADLERVAVIGPLTCLLHSGRHLDGALRTQRVTAVVLETDGTLTVISGGRVGQGVLDFGGVPAAR